MRGVVPLGEGVLTPIFCSAMSSNFGEICEKKTFLVKKISGVGVPPTPHPQIATNMWIFWAHYAVEKKQSSECKQNLGGGGGAPIFCSPTSSNFGEIREK